MSFFWRLLGLFCLGAALAIATSRAAEPEASFDPIVFELANGNGVDFVTNPGRTDHRHQPETMVSGVALFDYDNDGDLDLFVSNYCVWDPETEPLCGPRGLNDYCHPKNYRGLPNSLFRNDRDGTFTDVSVESGIRKVIGKGMGLAIADYDDDGWMDVFVANDTQPNYLFRNLGDGTFEEIGFMAGVAYPDTGRALSGMGADAGDIDDDGKVDIFHTALSSETMPIFHNQGDNTFLEITTRAGVSSLTLSRSGWSNAIVDFNNDGRKDLFVCGGDVMDPEGEFKERVPQTNLVMANLGGLRFQDASPGAGKEFSTRKAVHRGGAFGDLDNDGRVDAVVTDLHGPIEVWRNVSPTPNHWLLIRTVGTKSNRDGIGARVKLTTPSKTLHSHVKTAVGYGGASDPRVHFGLGSERTPTAPG